jgi:hypothetical protein
MGFMNARRLVLATVVSLFSLGAGVLLAAPVALAEESCQNAASRQGPSAELPECRAYEQVTPVNKGDSPDLFPSKGTKGVSTIQERGYVAEDGEHFLLLTEASFAGGDAYFSNYVFSRGTEGWTTTAISPGPGVHRITPHVFNPADLSEVGVEDTQHNQVPGQPEETLSPQLVGPPGGPYTTVESLPGEGTASMVGASADLSHVVLESDDHELAPGDTGQDADSKALYEWVGGQLRLVNVTSNGSLLSPCGANLGQTDGMYGGAYSAVSSDGSKIFFTAPDPNWEGTGCWNHAQENPPQIYMRLDGTSTVDVSTPDPGVVDPDGLQPALFAGASADGSKVFFITRTELTADDTTHAFELYEYDTEAPEGERLVRVSSGESGTAEGNVDFVGAISSDGSTVYFTAFGKLAQGASALSEEGGLVNLYRYDTVTRKTTYITEIKGNSYPLTPGEIVSSRYVIRGENGFVSDEMALDAEANWYGTANGQYLVFGSELPLTGYDNMSTPGFTCEKTPISESQPTEPCTELFRYSAADNSIVCVSCGSVGVHPVENTEFDRLSFSSRSAAPVRPISEDGSDVFFQTFNALVPQATDGVAHVYEWHDGKISLISSAGDTTNSYFLGTSADGSNVFFGTHSQLVPQDTDQSGDVYDARVDGGFVGVTPPLCTGTGCQGVPSAPPIFATPASVTFEGIGNFLAS